MSSGISIVVNEYLSRNWTDNVLGPFRIESRVQTYVVLNDRQNIALDQKQWELQQQPGHRCYTLVSVGRVQQPGKLRSRIHIGSRNNDIKINISMKIPETTKEQEHDCEHEKIT